MSTEEEVQAARAAVRAAHTWALDTPEPDWPNELYAWVARAYAQCSTDDEAGRLYVEDYVGMRIRDATRNGSMWTNDWTDEPLPDLANKNSPLLMACMEGRIEEVETLLAANAQVDETSGVQKSTPLFNASYMGHADIVAVLLAANATVDLSGKDGYSPTPLFIACQQGHGDIVTTLLAAKAAANHQASNGYSPLIIASLKHRTGIVNTLLAAGAVVNMADSEGYSPLIAACTRGPTEEVATTVTTLLAANASVDQRMINGYTPMLLACVNGHVDVVTQLIAVHALVDQDSDEHGNTPLILASADGHTAIVTQLIAAKANVNQAQTPRPSEYSRGYVPLHSASMNGQTEVVKILLAAAVVDQGNDEDIAPLWFACSYGNTEVVSVLLDAGADVEQPNENDETPLHIACIQGHLGVVQILSSYGADRSFLKPAPDDTAEHVAVNAGHIDDLAAWLVKSRHWSTALHHLDVVTRERAFKLLRGGADIEETDGALRRPSPFSLARIAAVAGGAKEGTAAFLVLEAAKPWRRQTHKLFPAPARARAVELMLIGELLSREERFAAYGPQAVVDAWMGFVVPKALSRHRVQVVGLKARPELNGERGICFSQGASDKEKGRYPVYLDSGAEVLVKLVNLVSIADGDDVEDRLVALEHFESLRVRE